MPEGGDIHIRVYQKAKGYLCISVEDQGFGIENEKLEKIGKAFTQQRRMVQDLD